MQKNEIRGAVLFKIEEGRRLLGLDVVVRTPDGQAANETNTPIVQLYQLVRSKQSPSTTNVTVLTNLPLLAP